MNKRERIFKLKLSKELLMAIVWLPDFHASKV